MHKNGIGLFNSFCLIVSITICGCSSDSSSSNTDPKENPTVGTTEENPYEISSAEDLIQLASDVNSCKSYAGVYFKMTADIVLNEGNASEWGGNGSHKCLGSHRQKSRYYRLPLQRHL